GAALRGEVLAAAMDILRETGSEEAMSLRAVAERVGVSVPSIYLHFADKQALLEAVCEEVFEQLHVALKEADADAVNPWEALRAQGIAYVRFAVANPEHYRIVMMAGPSEHDPKDEIASGAFGHLLDSVVGSIALGVLEGDPIELSLKLWAAAHGLASLLITKPKMPWPPLEDLIDETMCFAGLGLATASRIDPSMPADQLVARLNTLR
ncbi:MAG: TetR/AcrR family transcriptional regulator, partial [Mycobacteriales bacterium]